MLACQVSEDVILGYSLIVACSHHLRVIVRIRLCGVTYSGGLKDRAVEEGADIIIATPGRLLDLVYDGSLRLKAIKQLVIDEVDEMLNLGFRTQLNNILDLLPPKRQNLLFSATITPDVEIMMHTYFNAPQTIEAAPTGTPLANINQIGYYVPNFYTKVNLLKLLLSQNEDMTKILIFVATKHLADQLFEQIETEYEGKAGIIHSNKEQNNRFNTIKQFQEGTFRFIIATDIVARGLDIAEVSHAWYMNLNVSVMKQRLLSHVTR